MAKYLSPRAQKIIAILAQDEGRKSHSEQLLPEHFLLALLNAADGLGYILLQQLKINILNLRMELEKSLINNNEKKSFSNLPVSRRLRTLLDAASVESRTVSKDYVGTEHLVIAAIKELHSPLNIFFTNVGIGLNEIYDALSIVYKKHQSSADIQRIKTAAGEVFSSLENHPYSKHDNKKDSILTEYSKDLTLLAKEQKLDPIIGRNIEIKRIIQILSRRTKNNPVLVGEPGVGKTAIIEGLAQKILEGKVPRNLLNKKILSLDLGSVVAGTKYRGEFEERIKLIMKEVVQSKNIILFIDEIHTVIGAGGSEGSMDASNLLKPALARGELQCIGATTSDEYRKYFEKDAALERRFQSVLVEEPSDEETIQILEGIRSKYEQYHCVKYAEDVFPLAVRFSRRYLPERCLPDKAIDLIDEAGAMKKIDEEERPVELDNLEHSINLLVTEKQLLVQNQDYEQAANVRDKVNELKKQLDFFRQRWEKGIDEKDKIVTTDDICSIISTMTGIPTEQMSNSEMSRLLHMEDEIHKTVIGQSEAVTAISSSIRRSRTGISSSKRPSGSFIFLGPTGVGKTLLAKSLAKFLFGSEDALIRIDMSDFMEKHNSSRLVGAPPGYVGFEEGGVLTEKVRRHPYSVILLDEIEKAHSDVFNLLLQILEEGEITDNLGHTINFRNTVIIMTSNAGIRDITENKQLGFSISDSKLPAYETIKNGAMSELKKILSPELINRIDDIVVFNSLTRKEIASILDIQLNDLSLRLKDLGLNLSVKKSAKDYLIDNGYEIAYGARPMRRLIQNEIEDQIATKIIEFSAKNNDTLKNGEVCINCRNNKLQVSLNVILPITGNLSETSKDFISSSFV